MPKFVFRLQSYLSIKEKLEDQKRLEYGKAIKVLELEKQRKQALEEEKAGNILSMKQNILEGIRPDELNRYNHYIDFTKKRIVNQVEVIKKEETNVEQKRLILVEAMKERKTLDTLREKSLEEYKIEEKRLEHKQVDEVTSYQYGQKKKS